VAEQVLFQVEEVGPEPLPRVVGREVVDLLDD
jgi:hypothetical protein